MFLDDFQLATVGGGADVQFYAFSFLRSLEKVDLEKVKFRMMPNFKLFRNIKKTQSQCLSNSRISKFQHKRIIQY